MKKLLTILLVLLVAGFVFAASAIDPGDAKLILTSDIGARTWHGFYGGAAKTGFADIASYGQGVDFDNTEDVDMEDDNEQYVGFYSYASNSTSGVTVTLTGSALNYSNAYVPYKLNFYKYDQTQNDFAGTAIVAVTGFDDELTAKVGTAITDFTSQTLLQSSSGSGQYWDTFKVSVEFDGTGNLNQGLPEGSYEGRITANVVAN